VDHLGLWIGVIALAITLYAAAHARRSATAAERAADAAERSARSAEEAVALGREEIREAWIGKLTAALPDGKRVTRLLVDLPDSLREEWRQLVTSAAGRNPRTPDGHFRELLEKHSTDWERAAENRSLPTERTKP
jgi:hypothetical protein